MQNPLRQKGFSFEQSPSVEQSMILIAKRNKSKTIICLCNNNSLLYDLRNLEIYLPEIFPVVVIAIVEGGFAVVVIVWEYDVTIVIRLAAE